MSDARQESTATPREDKCWNCGGDASDHYFDRSVCPEPCGGMHTRCVSCGMTLDQCFWETAREGELTTARAEGVASAPATSRAANCAPPSASGQTQARESAASGAPDGEAKRYRACVCCTPPRAWPHDEDPTEGRTDDGYDEMGLPGTRIGAGAAATAETCGSVVARGESRHATQEAAGGDPGSAPVGHSARESVLLAFTLPHKGHDGIPGAPDGVYCIRCIAERALDRLLADLAAAERREEQLREAHLKVEDGMIVLYVNGEPDTNYGFGLGLGQVIDRVAALDDVGGEQQGSDDECICSRLSDLPDGTIIADLTCPVHGVEGSDPGDVLPGAVSRGDKP